MKRNQKEKKKSSLSFNLFKRICNFKFKYRAVGRAGGRGGGIGRLGHLEEGAEPSSGGGSKQVAKFCPANAPPADCNMAFWEMVEISGRIPGNR